jgi:hypothetical protein
VAGDRGDPARLPAWLDPRPLLQQVLPPWLRRWGVSLASLATGLAVLLVFRRGLPHVGWIVGYLVLLWLAAALLTEARAPLVRRGRRLVVSAWEYTIQTLYHNLLLFVLPAYYAAATLTSPNALLPVGVALGALVTAVDPWYRGLLRAAPWARHLFLGFASFAALNVALPLVGIPPIGALLGSAGLASLALAPAFRRGGAVSWRRALAWALPLAAVAVVGVWMGRALVPPAPLFLARAVAARDVAALIPVEPIAGRVPEATVAAWGSLVAYTAVYAPAGLTQPIAHVWRRDGQVLARIPLSPVRGGRAEGFRTWSRRTDLRPPLQGRWTVDVETASGQLIGRLRFTITP